MNETAQQLITDAGAKVLEYLEAGEGFAAEQAPLLAQEIVRYGVWKHSAVLLVFSVCFIVAVIVASKAAPKIRDLPGDPGQWVPRDFYIVQAICACVAIIVCAPVSIVQANELLKVVTAPRLYIIEQIARLM